VAESGIGTAIRAAPESIKQVLQFFYASQWYTIVAESGIGTASSAAPESMIFFTSYHAAQWYQLEAESGIGTACRVAPKGIIKLLPAIMRHRGIKWMRSLA